MPAAATATAVIVGTGFWVGGALAEPPVPAAPGGGSTAAVAPSETAGGTPSDGARLEPTTPTPSAPELPELTPHMDLPKHQRYADFVPVSSDMRLKGAAIGLGRFHSRGEPVNLVLVPGRSLPGVFSDGPREGMCIIALPARDPIEPTDADDWREYTCHFLPRAASTEPEHVGGGGITDPASTGIDEFQAVQLPLMTTSSETSTVEFTNDGISTALAHRITHPDLHGAIFIGVVPDVPVTSREQTSFVGRNSAGQVLFRR